MLNIVLKGFVPLLLTAFAFFSCTSSKKTTAAVSRDELKGTWQLDNITYEGLPQDQKVKLTLLGEGPEVCLKGARGCYLIMEMAPIPLTQTMPAVPQGQRSIVWSYRVENDQPIFQYKKLPGGVKAEDVLEGYKFTIVDAAAEKLNLKSNVNFEGSTISIHYQFSKK
jgi:hypothetical protein